MLERGNYVGGWKKIEGLRAHVALRRIIDTPAPSANVPTGFSRRKPEINIKRGEMMHHTKRPFRPLVAAGDPKSTWKQSSLSMKFYEIEFVSNPVR